MDHRVSPWAVAGLYAAAVAVGLFPLIDLFLGAWPFRPAEALWRYGFLGVASGGSLPVWILSVGLLVGLAHIHGARRALQWVAAVALSLAALTLPVMAVFAWDLLEVSSVAQPEQARVLRIRGVTVLAKYVGAGTAFAMMGYGTLQAARRMKQASEKDAPMGMIMRPGGNTPK